MTIADLFARIGLKTDEGKAKSFQKTMLGVKTGLIAVTGVAAATALAIRKITADAFEAAVAFKQFETETGSSAQELQKWQAVAQQTNQSAESVTSAIKSIVSNQEKIKLGQGNISGFQILGIDPRQDPFKILEDLREKTKGLSDGMKKNILQQMGVGAGLLQTLSLTREEFDIMASRAFIVSPQAIETLNKTKASVDLASNAIKYIKTQIAVGLSPQIRETTKRFTEFIKVNEKGIIEGFKKGYKFVSLFLKAITNTATMINDLVTSTIGWEKTIKIAAIAFGVLNAVMMASPIGLITAGIILLIAVLDDIYTYSQGGKSLFGKLMDRFPELEKGLFGFIDKIIEIKDLFKAFASGDEMGIDKILSQWGSFGDIIQLIYDNIKKLQDILEKGEIFGKPISSGLDVFKNIREKLSELTGVDKDQRFQFVGPAGFVDTGAGGGGGGGGGGGQNNTITIEVNGSGDPDATGNAVANALQRTLNSASAQMPRNE